MNDISPKQPGRNRQQSPAASGQAEFDRHLQTAKQWAWSAQQGGWLSESDAAQILGLENRNPAKLFEPGAHRPLVAAFFGGTGVGKSSLLNRLAGQTIATVGVERPTSREVSIFLHESLAIRQLPAGFPVDRVRVARHRDDLRRQVLWIDMPDIDSTEASNRDLVADWLPHIDVLIYVVSPERYRDDKGWRVLREQVRDHAWLFVMNQWDRGQEAQVADFIKLLSQGGFDSPLLFRTDCQEEPGRRKPDEFAQLESTLQTLADSHLMEQLERRAAQSRCESLRSAVTTCLARLTGAADPSALQRHWQDIWEETGDGIVQGLQWPMGEVARAFVQHDANPLRRAINLNQKPEKPVPATAPKPSLLWDDWAQMQWQDALDRLLMEAAGRQLPTQPLKAKLSQLNDLAPKLMTEEAQKGLRLALAKPGNLFQRVLLKFTALCLVLLPLAAMAWVSWQAVTAYYASASSHTGFLGTDFAIHSGLLVGIAWLLPFFLNLQLKPSHEKSALKGLRNGVNAGLARLQLLAENALSAYASELAEQRHAGEALLEQTQQPGLLEYQPEAILGRVIPHHENC